MTPTYFDSAAIKKSVESLLPADVKPGEKVIVGSVDTQGAQIVAAMKFHGDRWEVQAVARHNWTGENAAEGRVILRW